MTKVLMLYFLFGLVVQRSRNQPSAATLISQHVLGLYFEVSRQAMLALESYIHGVWRLELMTRRVGPRGSAACHEGALTRHWAQHGCFIGNSCGPHSNSKAWWTGDDPRYRGDQGINLRCNVKGLCL
ncbi:MAG: hypothetical protein ABI992_06705 [Chthoniobacterales bacterium]